MRVVFTFLFVLFFVSTSAGQSFTLQEMIKLSKLDLEKFDTYVTTKGYEIYSDDKLEEGAVCYAKHLSTTDAIPANFISKNLNHISIQSHERNFYLKIKNQLKVLGFKLVESKTHKMKNGDNGLNFVYRKGISAVVIYVGSNSNYEINYVEKMNWPSFY